MLEKILIELGAKPQKKNKAAIKNSLSKILSNHTSLPTEYTNLLMYFGGDIEFKNDIEYKPLNKNPWTSKNGRNSLDLIYGLTSKYPELSLSEVIKTYSNRIPKNSIPIALTPGGNQICLYAKQNYKNNGIIFFWDHESELNPSTKQEPEKYLIANSFSEFIELLEVSPPSGFNLNNVKIDLKF